LEPKGRGWRGGKIELKRVTFYGERYVELQSNSDKFRIWSETYGEGGLFPINQVWREVSKLTGLIDIRLPINVHE
jgi:hypothetical protein